MTAAEVIAVLERYAVAIVAGDGADLDALLDADYEFVSAHARTVDRDRRLVVLAAGPQTLARLTFSDPDVRIIGGGVAIARAAFTAEFHAHTGRAQPDRGVSTLVFRRRRDRWLLCHQHNSHGL